MLTPRFNMQHEDRVRIQHMLDACSEAGRFVAGRVRSDLESDRMLLFALIRCIEIIGEAASRVSDAGKAETPYIPWRSVIAMRNRLIHGYFDVDPNTVWITVTEELPALSRLLMRIVSQ